jgi:hypothetical protein
MGGFTCQETGVYQLVFALTLYRNRRGAFIPIHIFTMLHCVDCGEQPVWAVTPNRIRDAHNKFGENNTSGRDVTLVSKGERDV